MKGYVTYYNFSKGYGFIKGENGQNYFFHVSSVDSSDMYNLDKDVKVEFKTEPNPKGEVAVKIKVIK
jgi:cold shock CspA family protein